MVYASVRIEAHPDPPGHERSFLDPIQKWENRKKQPKEREREKMHVYNNIIRVYSIGFDFNGIKTFPNQCVLFLKAIRLMKSDPSTMRVNVD